MSVCARLCACVRGALCVGVCLKAALADEGVQGLLAVSADLRGAGCERMFCTVGQRRRLRLMSKDFGAPSAAWRRAGALPVSSDH